MEELHNQEQSKSESVSPIKNVFIPRVAFLLYLFILGMVYEYFNLDMANNDHNLFITYFPSSFGAGIGLGFVAFIIALIRKIKKKKPTKGIYIAYFTISTICFFFSMVSVMQHLSNISESESQYNESDKYVYWYFGNEYRITFEKKPNITDISAPLNGKFINAEQAELVIPEYKSFYRTECFNVDKSYLSNFNKEFVFNYLNKYAQYNGLLYPTFQYEENSLGKIGYLRAYKNLKGNANNDIKITYFSKIIVGDHSFVVLYVGCKSEDYPTPSITRFINSVIRYKG